jgi:hypothetical protein
MPAGTWRLALVSGGGVRLCADGQNLIDEWRPSWTPRRCSGLLRLPEPREVELVVEQFRDQLYLALALEITPAE